MAQKGVDSREPTLLDLEVLNYGPHPDIDYSIYSVDIGEEVYTSIGFRSPGQRRQDEGGYKRFVAFVRWLEKKGGVQRYLHSTKSEIIADDDTLAKEDRLLEEDWQGRKLLFSATKRSFAATKWYLHIRLPALLHTIQEWNSLPHPHSWVLARIAEGWTYSEIANALHTDLSVLLNWLTNAVDPTQLKAAWTARTVIMLESADRLYSEAVNGDFDSECGRNAAESRAKVLSATNGHLKMQAVSRHSDYKPAQTNIAITPGSISISLAAPELPAP